jgi:hypothetical protein
LNLEVKTHLTGNATAFHWGIHILVYKVVSDLPYMQNSSNNLVRLTTSNINILISLKYNQLYMNKLTQATAAKHKKASVTYLSAHMLRRVTY